MRGEIVAKTSPKASVLKELKMKYIAFGGKKITPASHTLQIGELFGQFMRATVRFKTLLNYYLLY